jgi:hypothetical protein
VQGTGLPSLAARAAEARGEGFVLHVKTFSGQTTDVPGNHASDTLLELRERVAGVLENTTPEVIKLFFKGNALTAEEQTLAQNEINGGSVVHMVRDGDDGGSDDEGGCGGDCGGGDYDNESRLQLDFVSHFVEILNFNLNFKLQLQL